MLKKMQAIFLSSYQESSLEIRIKTKILLYVGLLLIVMTLLPIILLAVSHSLSVDFYVRIISLLLVSLSLYLLKNNKYHASSNVIISATFVLLPVFVYVRGYNHYYEMYTVAFFLLFVLLISCLIGYSKFQPVFVIAASIILEICSYIIRVLPHSGGKVEMEQISSLFFIILFDTACGFIGYLLMNNTNTIIELVEQEADSNLKRFKKLEEALKSSKRGLTVGENLVGASEKSIRYVEVIDRNILGLKNEMASLNEEIKAISSSNIQIAEAAKDVADIIREQESSVGMGTAAIEEMTRSIQSIADNAKGKEEAMQDLVKKANDGEGRINDAFRAMEQISRSAEEMMGIVQVIIGVAEQTNMLAMNAAIEAAHAGQYGAGFSIVASEIRSLSNETNTNTKEITLRIQNNNGNIRKALELNSASQAIFRQLNSEVTEVSGAIREMTLNLKEISDGTRDTLESINAIVRLSNETVNSIKTVEEMIGNNDHAVGHLNELSGRIYQNLESLMSDFLSIQAEVCSIHEIGLENIKNIESLENEIRQIKI